jgi:hypothetical protein
MKVGQNLSRNLTKVYGIEQSFFSPKLSVLTKFCLFLSLNDRHLSLHTNIADTYIRHFSFKGASTFSLMTLNIMTFAECHVCSLAGQCKTSNTHTHKLRQKVTQHRSKIFFTFFFEASPVRERDDDTPSNKIVVNGRNMLIERSEIFVFSDGSDSQIFFFSGKKTCPTVNANGSVWVYISVEGATTLWRMTVGLMTPRITIKRNS